MHFGCSKRITRPVGDPSLLVDSAELFLAYYIPPSDIKAPLEKTFRQSYCEWKGFASYFNLQSPDGSAVENRAWCYKTPTPRFQEIKDYVSFYAGPWDCYVDGEKVEPQPGMFTHEHCSQSSPLMSLRATSTVDGKPAIS